MGRIRTFLNQDANQAIDRIVEPYVRFMLKHWLLTWLAFPPFVALIWIYVSKTWALLMVALSVVFLLWGIVRYLLERHVPR
ncbi:MAG TPA: hypothetical protein VGW30_04675 [Gaiellaceae bacterium]|nr:hypothetical protein [Gaiellaceae bacterium]